jgi:hypothetical protein
LGFDSPLLAALAFAGFAVLAVLLPGLALQRVLRRPIDTALVIPLGTAFCAGAYWLSLVTGGPVFPAAVVAMDACLLLPLGPWRWASGPPFRGVTAPFAALCALLAVTQYPWNRIDGSGAFVLDALVPFDTAFHVGLSRELTLGYPPQVPGVSGFPLGYHLGTDLVRAAALRWAGVSPFDAISRLDVTLYGLGLMLALQAVAARLRATPMVVALAPWTALATDFSFVFGGLPTAHWWADLFRGNLLLSLFVANPIVPALTLLLAALLAFDRHETEGGARGDLAAAALLALAVPFFKVFLGAHLLLGMGAAFVLGRPAEGRRGPLLILAIPVALATAFLVLGQGGETVDVSVAPFDLARVTESSLGIGPYSGAGFLAWAALWLLVSLGVRVVGTAPAVRALRGPQVLTAALAAMALAAWPLGLLFRVSAPEVLPGQKFVNDAGYLLEQGGPLLWLFTLLGLQAMAQRTHRATAVWLAAGLLSVPSTIQFVAKKAFLPPDPMPAATVRAMKALQAASAPGDVVMQRPAARFPPAPVILIGRRVPYERFTPYLTQFATKEALEERHRALYRFFQTPDRDEAIGIARGLRARFLVLYGRDRVRFDGTGVLVPVYEEEDARVYRFAY